METIIGTWVLIGSISINNEIAFIGEEPDLDGVKNWLNESGKELIEDVKGTEGLKLVIAPDGKFKEIREGNPDVYWFSSEGVLEDEVMPFNGTVKNNEYGYFLIPKEVPTWATPKIEYGVILRYDDGDTKISDQIFQHEGNLVRTINVVTDEAYLDRIVIVYNKM